MALTVDIYGDSFSCPCCKTDEKDTYLDILSDQFLLDNTSKHGVGAQWCVEKFMARQSHGDFLLFCLPDAQRLWLQYLPDYMASQSNKIYAMMKAHNMDFPEELEELAVEEAPKIFKDYEGYYNTGMHRIFEVLASNFILSKAKHYKKVLIWPSSGSGFPFRNYNYALEIPSNVLMVPKSLSFISQFEINNKTDRPHFDFDTRSNHLSHANHIVLAKQISQFFLTNKHPDIMEFKRYIYGMQ